MAKEAKNMYVPHNHMQVDFSNLTHEPSTFQKVRNFQKKIVVSSILSKNSNFPIFSLASKKLFNQKIKRKLLC